MQSAYNPIKANFGVKLQKNKENSALVRQYMEFRGFIEQKVHLPLIIAIDESIRVIITQEIVQKLEVPYVIF